MVDLDSFESPESELFRIYLQGNKNLLKAFSGKLKLLQMFYMNEELNPVLNGIISTIDDNDSDPEKFRKEYGLFQP